MGWGRKTDKVVADLRETAEKAASGAGDVARMGLEEARRSLDWAGDHLPAGMRRSELIGSGAVGALALGAFALGAVAIGAFAIGRLSVGKASVGSADIGRLRVGRLEIGRIAFPPHLREGRF